ncbi:hypothetical protein B0T25DRAFT_81504 [Lasiosphaeria hispida]|uniref:Uncharacterized protein n=1 Tax=Lasiosphaeria hispida TaxID=260671 RepID=A0AAJ0HPI1_9PEZI|nr:hypothetical protein B0T25DRAFT_81504 [Lasiosphaeria hispida]
MENQGPWTSAVSHRTFETSHHSDAGREEKEARETGLAEDAPLVLVHGAQRAWPRLVPGSRYLNCQDACKSDLGDSRRQRSDPRQVLRIGTGTSPVRPSGTFLAHYGTCWHNGGHPMQSFLRGALLLMLLNSAVLAQICLRLLRLAVDRDLEAVHWRAQADGNWSGQAVGPSPSAPRLLGSGHGGPGSTQSQSRPPGPASFFLANL